MLQVMSVVICFIGFDMLGFGLVFVLLGFFYFSFNFLWSHWSMRKLGKTGLAMESDDLHLRKSSWTLLPQFNDEKVNKKEKYKERAETSMRMMQRLPWSVQHGRGAISPHLERQRSKGLTIACPLWPGSSQLGTWPIHKAQMSHAGQHVLLLD